MRRPIVEATPRLDLREVYRELGFTAMTIPKGEAIKYTAQGSIPPILLENGPDRGSLRLQAPDGLHLIQVKALPTIQGRGARAAVTCPSCSRWVEVLTFHQWKAGCRVCQGLLHQSTRDPGRACRVRKRLWGLLEG